MSSAFEKIIGYTDLIKEYEKICDRLKNTEKYKKMGVDSPRGILLYGDPGLGKTLMANCIIEEIARPTYVIRKDKPDGEFINYIKETFLLAESNAPSVVFLDDLDKFSDTDRYDSDAEEFVAVQACIDSVKEKEVFVIATANNEEVLPRSLMRVGRFDKVLEVTAPRRDCAENIIAHYLSKKPNVGEVNAKEIARLLRGMSCAVLESVINEAGARAAYLNKEKIDMEDIIQTVLDTVYKSVESSEKGDERTLRRVAYHEAGHAVVAEVLNEGVVTLVTVNPRSTTGTVGFILLDRDSELRHTMAYVEQEFLTCFGGKVATEMYFCETDIGCSADLSDAHSLAHKLICRYGQYGMDNVSFNREVSPTLAAKQELAVSQEMTRGENTVRRILTDNRDFLDEIAEALVEKKTLTSADIKAIRAKCILVY